MNLRLAKLADLKPDPNNAREHGDENLEAIEKSLRNFEQVEPLVVQKSTGVVIGGNGRLAVMAKMGLEECWVVDVDLDDQKARALGIALNRTGELAEWNQQRLADLLASLPQDVRCDIGFGDADYHRMLAQLNDGQTVDDEAPPPEKMPVSRVGDLWILGNHRLLNGDCTDPAQVRRLMNGQRAVLFATDPPYLVDYDGCNHPNSGENWHAKKNKDWSKTYGTTWDEKDGAELYDKFYAVAIADAITVDAAWYCWHASRRQAMLEAVWEKYGAFVHQTILWVKTKPVLTRSWYLWQHEPCFMGSIRSEKPKRIASVVLSNVWQVASGGSATDNGHPTSKPIELFAIPMRQHTVEGDVCYEPFSGSGSQMIAAEQLKRRCYATEIEPVYVDVAVRRWQKLTGNQATHAKTGHTWAQTASERGVPVPP